MSRTVLVSGASIAGPAVAFWLARHGLVPTVVERFPRLRPGGQTVDLRGAGRTVVRRMGLEDAVRARTTGERGIRFVDSADRVKATLAADAFGGGGPVAELEILRGDLSELLHDRTRDTTEYLFGDEITGLTDLGDRVRVAFREGPDREFDLVVLADGLRSRTRDLLFADVTRTRSFGLYTAYFTIARSGADDGWARWHNAPGRRTVLLRPDNQGTTRALLSFLSDRAGYEKLPVAAQRNLLRARFAGVGWEAPRVLAGLAGASDFYFEAIGQVRLSRWSRGRVVVLGDAAYCASPISGMGTSLALVGAYVLAGELGRHPDHAAAFAGYEAVLRPYAERAQQVSPRAPRIASPRTAFGIGLLNAVLATAAKPGISRVLGKFLVPPADGIDLPDYGSAPGSAG